MVYTYTAFYEKHERLRHPPIFYMGHTAAFHINKLHLGKFITERVFVIDARKLRRMLSLAEEKERDDKHVDEHLSSLQVQAMLKSGAH